MDKVRKHGYYLVKWNEEDEFVIEEIVDGEWWDHREENTPVEEMGFFYIADEPLNLKALYNNAESIKL